MELWNGTAWTEVNNLNVAKTGVSAVGISTAAHSVGGNSAPPATNLATTEVFDGSSWTEVGDLNTARYTIQGGGTSTLSFGAGGYTNTQVASTEEFAFSASIETIAFD